MIPSGWTFRLQETSSDVGRQFSDDPIQNYFGWGLIAGFMDYFIRQALSPTAMVATNTTTTTTTTATPASGSFKKVRNQKKQKKNKKEKKTKKHMKHEKMQEKKIEAEEESDAVESVISE